MVVQGLISVRISNLKLGRVQHCGGGPAIDIRYFRYLQSYFLFVPCRCPDDDPAEDPAPHPGVQGGAEEAEISRQGSVPPSYTQNASAVSLDFWAPWVNC